MYCYISGESENSRITPAYIEDAAMPDKKKNRNTFSEGPGTGAEATGGEKPQRSHDPAGPDSDPVLRADKTFGVWKALRLIGRGGMGAVYLAERADGQYQQQAALKILPMGFADKAAQDRFLLERQILARLVHDNIARLLDGGVTDEGVPYFVMDYVDGIPIDAYCEQEHLNVADRLSIVLDVTAAVQHAHRNLIIHRDLKPANVLAENNGRVRLVDFGIATLLEPASGQAPLTRTTQRLATPEFASPEMLRGDVVDVTTDVYSLGALLYLLLTGRFSNSYDGLSPAEILNNAETAEPPPASDHNPVLDGDMDAIVAKALAKAPADRYASVESLAHDLRSWLSGMPITAKPPSVIRRAKKFAGRHRLGVSLAASAVIALIGIAGVASYFAVKSEQQARAIALERDRAQQTADFLVGIFDSADGDRAAAELTAQEVLDTSRRRISRELADQPDVQIESLRAMSDIYRNMQLTDEWREVLGTELNLRADLHGTDDAGYAGTLVRFSELEDMAGNYDDALAYAEQALGISQQHDYRIGEAAAYRAVGRVLHLKGDYEDADAAYRSALEIYRNELGDDAQETDLVRHSLATLLNHMGEHAQSLQLLDQVLATRRQFYAGDHSEFSEVFLAKGSVLTSLGRYDEAVAVYEQAFAMNNRLLGPDNGPNYYIVNGLGKLAEVMGNYELAADHFAEAVRLNVLNFPNHPNLGISKANLGNSYMFTGQFDLAVPHYREAVTIIERHMPEHWMLDDMRWRLGHCIAKSDGNYEEAEPLILLGVETLTAQWGQDHPRTKAARDAAAELYEAWGKTERLAEYR